MLEVYLTDINDNIPVFEPNPTQNNQAYVKTINEGLSPFTPIIDINATDRDQGSNAFITYSITEDIANVFQINKSDGVVVLKSNIDRENMTLDSSGFGVLSLTVTAIDHGTNPQSSSVKVCVVCSVIFIPFAKFVFVFDSSDVRIDLLTFFFFNCCIFIFLT